MTRRRERDRRLEPEREWLESAFDSPGNRPVAGSPASPVET